MANNCLMTNHVRKIRNEQGLTLDELAELADISTSYLSRLESGGRKGSLETYVKISRALKAPVVELTDEFSEDDVLDRVVTLSRTSSERRKSETGDPMPINAPNIMLLDVPVMGTVAASGLGNGAFRLSNDIVEWAARPPALAGVPDLYALEVRGDSMSPKFEPGDIIYVHPHRTYRLGDIVVIQEPDSDNGEPQSFIKVFRKETPTDLVAGQYNPAGELKFRKRPGLVVHKVMTNRDLFGL